VPVQPAGRKIPFFCVHAAGGNVLFYRDLAKRLGNDQPFYGLQAVGMDHKNPRHKSVEEMAEYYIQEIRSLQPEGPYLLGASSYGGWIILEMANQIVAAGETVGFLALFDTHGPGYPEYRPGTTRYHRKLYQFAQTLEHHLGSLWMLEGRDRWSYMLEKASKARRQFRRRGLPRLKSLSRQAIQRVAAGFSLRPKTPGSLPESLRRTESNIVQAVRGYLPKKYPQKVTLFRATHQPYGIHADPYMGWDKVVTGEIEVHEVPGYHGDIVVEPRVRFLTDVLKECLEKAQSSPAITSSRRL
jgi:thioesterase domain-containing protein